MPHGNLTKTAFLQELDGSAGRSQGGRRCSLPCKHMGSLLAYASPGAIWGGEELEERLSALVKMEAKNVVTRTPQSSCRIYTDTTQCCLVLSREGEPDRLPAATGGNLLPENHHHQLLPQVSFYPLHFCHPEAGSASVPPGSLMTSSS